MASVLVVDDDPLVLELAATVLRRDGHEVRIAADAEAAAALVTLKPPEVAVVDVILPGKGGLTFVMDAFGPASRTAVVMMSGRIGVDGESFQGLTGRFGVRCLLAKPFNAEQLREAVAAALSSACQ